MKHFCPTTKDPSSQDPPFLYNLGPRRTFSIKASAPFECARPCGRWAPPSPGPWPMRPLGEAASSAMPSPPRPHAPLPPPSPSSPLPGAKVTPGRAGGGGGRRGMGGGGAWGATASAPPAGPLQRRLPPPPSPPAPWPSAAPSVASAAPPLPRSIGRADPRGGGWPTYALGWGWPMLPLPCHGGRWAGSELPPPGPRALGLPSRPALPGLCSCAGALGPGLLAGGVPARSGGPGDGCGHAPPPSPAPPAAAADAAPVRDRPPGNTNASPPGVPHWLPGCCWWWGGDVPPRGGACAGESRVPHWPAGCWGGGGGNAPTCGARGGEGGVPGRPARPPTPLHGCWAGAGGTVVPHSEVREPRDRVPRPPSHLRCCGPAAPAGAPSAPTGGPAPGAPELLPRPMPADELVAAAWAGVEAEPLPSVAKWWGAGWLGNASAMLPSEA
jgi:hypothetical protein